MTSISKSSLSNRAQTAEWMQQCRILTLSLFEGIDDETFCRQAHPDFSPIGWHLGHIAYTEALWILQRLAGYPPLFPEYHRLFAQDGLPKGDRVHLPPIPEVLKYLETVRSKVLNYLQIAPLEQQERLWRWFLQHESQHAETITIVLRLLEKERGEERGERRKNNPLHPSLLTPHSSPSDMVQIPGGYFEQGNESIDAQDNERPMHRVYLETYWIDRYPVTCEQYRSFMQAGGYQDSQWWSIEGWKWLQEHSIAQPLYWTDGPTVDHHPVYGVSWYEADAYARFVGKRLPTEAEWEKAATWNPSTQEKLLYPWGNEAPDSTRCNDGSFCRKTTPVDQSPQGKSPYGCYDMMGNVWEWTATWFEGYSGFEGYPYPGYSQVYFDGAHRVLKGGSWATFPWAMRGSFRNWYYSSVRQIFAGFRCASDSGT